MFSAETNNPVVPALTWTHISCTYTASGGRSEIYVNGVLKKEEFTGSGILSQVNHSLFISFLVLTEYHSKKQDCLGGFMSVTFQTVNFQDYGNEVCELLGNQTLVSKNSYEMYISQRPSLSPFILSCK